MERNLKNSFYYPYDGIIKQLACENFTKILQRLQNGTYCLQADFLFNVIPVKTSATLFLQTVSFPPPHFFFFSLFSVFTLLKFSALLNPLGQFVQLGHLKSNALNVLHNKTNINSSHDYCVHEKIFYLLSMLEAKPVLFMNIQYNLGTFPLIKPTFC